MGMLNFGACKGGSGASTAHKEPVSGQPLKDGRQDFWLIDHDVVAAGDGFGFPRAVGAALFEETVKRRHFEERCTDISLFGDALIGASDLQLFGKASGRMRG